jgi:NADH-ubiquinone oxidoreductase chain 6
MNNLSILNIYNTNGFYIEILDIITIISIISGILVILNKNPIISVLFLIGLFFNISAYLFSAGLSFIAFSYLLVYIGAISILFLFILMLINIRISELTNAGSNSISLLLFIGFIIYYIIYYILNINNDLE